MKIKAQISMVMNLDKCIGCHTCSVTCKNAWTNRPGAEYMYFNNIVTSYLVHSAILSMAFIGKQYIERFLPKKEASTKEYLKQLVNTLIKDLNNRYP